MLYYIFNYLHHRFHWPGTGLIQYISFRAAMAILTSFFLLFLFGKCFINFLQKRHIFEPNRALAIPTGDQVAKAHIPTMGGMLIILATVFPTLLFAKWDNVYIGILLVSTLWMGVIGCVDDYIKVFKQNKRGLNGWIKILGQMVLGCVVGSTLYFHRDVVIRDAAVSVVESIAKNQEFAVRYNDRKSTQTTIPFFKEHTLDYAQLTRWFGGDERHTWIGYIVIVTFIIVAVSNGANLTDGLDGLAAGTSVIVSTILAILAYLSGHIVFATYLSIMFIPNLGELTIFCSSFVGACMGFLWYNAYPAQIFMGDTGSLTIGAIIAVLAICIRKELLLPLLCGIFLIENVSVILQTSYFKYTTWRYGQGRRVFKMAPLHHHYQQSGWHESKIVTRFLMISFLLAIATLVTLKIR